MEYQFSPESEQEFQSIVTRYPTRLAALLPTLWLAQEQFKCLDRKALAYVAKRLDVPMTQVLNTFSFYTMYTPKPRGKYHIELCVNVACWLRGCRELQQVIKDELGLENRETSDDNLFTYEEVECLAGCGGAPMCQINGKDTYELTPQKLRDTIARLRKES